MPTRRALSAILVLLISCAPISDSALRPAGFPEAIREARSLGPSATEPRWLGRAEPLRVIHRSPVTEVEGLSAILVTFNQAMTRLGPDGDASLASGAIRVVPAVVANARWVAGDTLKLALSKPLQNAQRYEVTISTSLRALSGERLAAPVVWQFSTPRPRLVSVVPDPERRDRFDRLLPEDRLRLVFNLAVDEAVVRRHLVLRANGSALPLESKPVERDPKQLLVWPSGGFPPHAKLELELPAGLRSSEGPLGSEKPSVHRFETRRPLTAEIHCGDPADNQRRCWPMKEGSGLRIHLSEPVDRERLLKALTIVPPADLRRLETGTCTGDEKRRCGRDYHLRQDLLPAREYRVSLDPSLLDVFGQKLGKRAEARFATRSFPPGIFLPAQSGVREAWHGFTFKAVNLKQVRARVRPQQGAALVRFLECHERWDETHDAERCIVGPTPEPQSIKLTLAKNQIGERKLVLPRGLVVVTLESPEVVDSSGKRVLFRRIVVNTDLGLQARLTAYGIVAWTTALRSGQPVAGVQVEVYDRAGRKLAEARSDKAGLAEVPRSALGALLDGRPRPPLLPRGGRYHRWWRREKHIDPPELYVLASHGVGQARDEAYLWLGEPNAPSYRSDPSSRAQELWQKSWGHHDPEQSRDGDPDERRPRLEPVELGRYEAWEGEREQLAGYLSSERGIYRPGQTVYLQGALRRYRSWKGAPATGVRAVVRLVGTENEMIAERPLQLSARGVFRQTFTLPAVGRLGYHALQLIVAERTIASHGFKVAEYREPPFELLLESDPDREIRQGATLTARLQARYLFGGPVDGAAYRLSVTRTPHSFQVPGHDDYRAGASRWEVGDEPQTWLRREGALDASGRAQLTIPTPAKLYPWSCYQMIEAEVSSVDRQTVAKRHYLNQHPGGLYVAYKETPGEGDSARRKLLVVTPAGEAVADRTVRASLHPSDEKHYRPDWSRTLWKTTITVPKKGATLSIPWPDRRQYSLHLLLSVSDDAGHEGRTVTSLQRPDRWVRREEKSQEAQRQRDAELVIKLDRKESYLPGETATVEVTHRGPAREGVLFVARERVFRSIPLHFDRRGQAQARVPVEDRFARTVELRAVVARSGPALRGHKGPLLSATTTLEVSEKPYRLQVKLETDRPRYQPGDRVKLRLAVQDGLAKPRRSEVVVMAVDEAVLQLTGYHLPDPLHELLRTPASGVLADDVRRHLAALGIVVVHRPHADEAFGMGGLGSIGTGGGGGSGAGYGGLGARSARDSKPRRRFLTTAWHASLVTDETGRAEASFVLPDNLTRYRLMALAIDEARSSGTGEGSLEVDLPLLTLPALPRLLRVGDEARAGVVVHNSRLPTGTVRVRARVEGKALRLIGPAEREVKLAKGQQQEVRFGLRGEQVGEGKITIEVQLGAVKDSLEHRLPVKQALLPEAASVSGETRGTVQQGLQPLEALRPEHGGLEVSLASTALTGVEDGMEQLIDYPYGCLEQKSSRLLPMLAAVALGDRFAFKLPGEPRTLIRGGIDEILAMQRGDGGFGYWPGSSLSWPWATAYALIVLERARMVTKQVALTIPEGNLRRAVAYLKPYAAPFCDPAVRARRKPGQICAPELGPYEFSYRSFILYALALRGEEITAPALDLFTRRGHEPLFARAMLLAALATRPRPETKKAIAALTTELSDSLRVDGTWAHAEENLHNGYQVMMHSSDRSTAMVMLALLQAQPEHPMVPRLVRWFLLGRKQARFRNTQEAAWALLALWDYARLRERDLPDFEAGVWLGTERLLTAQFRGRSLKPVLAKRTMRELQRAARGAARDLIIGKRGRGTLYYVARLRYARRQLPTAARDHGFAVRKQIEVLDKAGRPLAPQRPPQLGDTVRITLEVESNEARRYVVVEDPLPAGMEALDVTLATGAKTFGGVDSWLQSSSWDHRELRDDRVLYFRDLMQPGKLTYRYLARVSFPGEFLAPPLRVEEMYTPEVYGHSAAGRVRFREP